ncbi:hypothetical protein [Mucilaginibacter sp. KACC 22063]|uniref:hypothetical protein n=1 Tax=Mucilaginibacter sp. KACC 22063 TaxID=3025666 RepID=UPI002366712E|nr:hypothetical protein [Mucilaginibacter sp. KACC 22063]WDF53934.1 hypothetical protein PQ461_13380 [Mucilaginibacter sp. KACC 22063]
MKTLKKTFFLSLLVISIIILGFKISNKGGDSQSMIDKSTYVRQFKLTYLKSLLKKSYNNSKAVQEILELDHSGFTEPILNKADYALIDSLTDADNTKLKADSAASIGNVAEGAEGKQPLNLIIRKLESKWLDSLAYARFNHNK